MTHPPADPTHQPTPPAAAPAAALAPTAPAAAAASAPAADPTITIDDFAKVILRTALVEEAILHPNADKLLVLTVNVGGELRTICAGIRAWWKPEDLVGKTIVIAANLAPRMMRGVESRGMLLAVSEPGGADVVPLTVMKPASHGLRVS